MNQTIVVVASVNMDLVVTVPRHPAPGETILGDSYATYPGGKGANQAVAAARAGGNVKLLGLTGEDAFGAELRSTLKASGVDTSKLGMVPGPSGIALITVDAQGENRIVVSSGANGCFTPDHLSIEVLSTAAVVLLQLEIPLRTVQFVIETTAARGIPVLLNPAPAQPLADKLLQSVDYLIINETEATLLSGVSIESEDDALRAAQKLRQRGVQTAIATLGSAGVVWSSPTREGHLPAHPVEVVDTTAAGDAFCGAFATCLAQGNALEDALQFANAAGAIAVTRPGAQPSLANRVEIERLLEQC